MKWDIKLINDKTIIYYNLQFQITLNQLKSLIFEVMEISNKNQIYNFLLDIRDDVEITLKPSEIFYIPSIIKDIDISYKYKTAILFSENSKNMDKYNFFADVSKNQAINLNYFTEMEDAAKWLTEK